MLILHSPLTWLVKLALFHLLLEIFGTLRYLRYWVYLGVCISGLGYFSFMVATIAFCVPSNETSQLAYLTAISSARCSHVKTVKFVGSAFNVLVDLYLLILPLPAVWSLQLPTRKKIGASAILLTGIVYVFSYSAPPHHSWWDLRYSWTQGMH